MKEADIRRQMVELGGSLFERGYAVGGAGNLSTKLDNGDIIATPTGSSLGRLSAGNLSKVSSDGGFISGNKPSKEVPLHLAAYRVNHDIGAVVHLHSTYLTALSCLQNLDQQNAIPAFTPYYVMRIGELPVIPYYKPGADELPGAIAALASQHRAILMASHGVVVFGKNLADAVNNAEELEETAKLFFILNGHDIRWFNDQQISELKNTGV